MSWESSLGKADAFKRLPQDSNADRVSFGCLWGICLGHSDLRTSRHSQTVPVVLVTTIN